MKNSTIKIKISNLRQARQFINRIINELRADVITESKSRAYNSLIQSLLKIFELEKLSGANADDNFYLMPKYDCQEKSVFEASDFIRIPKDDYDKFKDDLRIDDSI